MRITEITINNYRNLDGIKIFLDERINFIVGENNLGKSNFLILLNSLFTRRTFNENDFFNKSKPIEINFILKLDDCEIGIFEDICDVENTHQVSIRAVQKTIDDTIEFWHIETNALISPSYIRSLNYIHYDPLRNPTSELNFDRNKGVGKFLNYIIKSSLGEKKDLDLIKEQEIKSLIININSILTKIKSFNEYGISAQLENEVENLLSKIILLKDNQNRELNQTGYGVQFLMIVTLSIFEKLLLINDVSSYKGIFDYNENSENKKAISLVIGFDEPEIHLHPYMQRALMKYLANVIENKDNDFSDLLRTVFNIDKLIGQIIVVSHSPNILLNEYKQITRFYQNDSGISVKCGKSINFNSQQEKHLLKRFGLLKEAFYSRCVILVEGDLELASFPLFANTMGIDLDEHGISVINTDGKDSISPVIQLLNEFGISNVSIRDKDDNATNPTEHNFYQTIRRDFEDEIINIGSDDILIDILSKNTSDINNEFIQLSDFNKINTKYKIGISTPSRNLYYKDFQTFDLPTKKLYLLGLYTAKRFKTYILGRTIGEDLTLDLIPQIYRNVINKAVELSKNG